MAKPTKVQSLPQLDLHGFTTAEVPDAVDRFITSSTRKGHQRVSIMTGKGAGLVRKAVVEYLKLGGFPYEVQRMSNGEKNEGVLTVFLG